MHSIVCWSLTIIFIVTSNYKIYVDHCAPLTQWSCHKYKWLYDIVSKGRSLSFQEGSSYVYTNRLGESKVFILYKKNKKNKI